MADEKLTIVPFKTSMYSVAIYLDGIRKFSTIPSTYVEAVKQYAATNFSIDQIQTALANKWISLEEFEQTVAYMNRN